MPIYEYRCSDCDRSFETLVSPGRFEAECPKCGGVNLSRELSVFASARSASDGGSSSVSDAGPSGGCCGGACGCRN
jgi:putative FmdB family regulatory protein